MTFAVQFKHPPNCRSLILDNLELHPIRIPNAAITEDAATCVKRFERTALHSTMRLEAKFSGINAINQAVNTEQNFGLGALRVYALGNGDQSNAGERQSLVEVQSVRKFSR